MACSIDPSVRARLGVDLKTRFFDWCVEHGTNPSAYIRDTIKRALGEEPAPPCPVLRVCAEPETGKPLAVRIWLTPSEYAALTLHAEHRRCSRPTWVIHAVRAALTASPEYGADELEAHRESTREMLALGRNLNQIARRLNAHETGEHVTAGLVEELSRRVERHVETVQRATRPSAERWAIRADERA